MLEQYFLRPTTVDRIRSNWLAPQVEQYVEWMHAALRQNSMRTEKSRDSLPRRLSHPGYPFAFERQEFPGGTPARRTCIC